MILKNWLVPSTAFPSFYLGQALKLVKVDMFMAVSFHLAFALLSLSQAYVAEAPIHRN